MASDSLSQVGKTLKQSRKKSNQSLNRYSENFPKLERVRAFSVNPFEMHFKTKQLDNRVSMDLVFFQKVCICTPNPIVPTIITVENLELSGIQPPSIFDGLYSSIAYEKNTGEWKEVRSYITWELPNGTFNVRVRAGLVGATGVGASSISLPIGYSWQLKRVSFADPSDPPFTPTILANLDSGSGIGTVGFFDSAPPQFVDNIDVVVNNVTEKFQIMLINTSTSAAYIDFTGSGFVTLIVPIYSVNNIGLQDGDPGNFIVQNPVSQDLEFAISRVA